jgi:hypothetical protein
MQLSANKLLGPLIIVLSLLALARAAGQIQAAQLQAKSIAIDFPCSGDYDIREQGMNVKTRIAYCFSYWPFEYYGGTIYALGMSEQDKATVMKIRFRREGQMLYVNNHPVDIGEMYETVQYSLTNNPWLLFTYRFEIGNNGLISADLTAPPSVLFISGDVYKGWKPNPLGLIILGIGIGLVFLKL